MVYFYYGRIRELTWDLGRMPLIDEEEGRPAF
jgi:hypothetical protein